MNLSKKELMKVSMTLKSPSAVDAKLKPLIDGVQKGLGLNLDAKDVIRGTGREDVSRIKKDIKAISDAKNSSESFSSISKYIVNMIKDTTNMTFKTTAMLLKKVPHLLQEGDKKVIDKLLSTDTRKKIAKSIETNFLGKFKKDYMNMTTELKENVILDENNVLLQEGLSAVAGVLFGRFIYFSIAALIYKLFINLAMGKKYRDTYKVSYKGLLFLRKEEYNKIKDFVTNDEISLIRRVIVGLFTLSYAIKLAYTLRDLVTAALV